MLRLAALFLVTALVCGFLGFGGVTNYSWEGGRIFFFIFLILAVMSFINGTFWRRRPGVWD